MLEKIKNYQEHPWLNELRDTRVLGQLAFLVVVLLVSWSGVKAIQTNYELQQQISRLQQEIAVQKLANTNLKLKNEYYNTPQYLELAARQNYGLAMPGEKELIVPKNVALAYAGEVTEPSDTVEPQVAQKLPFYQKNMNDWVDFFLNRQKQTI